MKKIHLLPNILTAFGLTCGLFAIFKINMTKTGAVDVHVLTATAGILLLAMFSDVLDGALARAMKAESEFGGLFDSLADAISFGVAPAVIVLKTFSFEPGTEISFFMTTAAMVFSVSGVLRLVRYSVSDQAIKKEAHLMASRDKNFTGLPIPAAAAAILSINLSLLSDEVNRLFSLDEYVRAWIIFFVMIGLGYLMISRWKFPSLKKLQIRVASFQVLVFTVIGAAVIFYGLLYYFPLVFFGVSWVYIFTAITLSIIRLLKGKASKTLEDFEPDQE